MQTFVRQLVLLATILAWAAQTALAGTVVGRVKGQFEATPTGAVSYTIPIDVATGMNGLRPAVALVYNSQTGRGEAGTGWSLTGFSEITRCPLTHALDTHTQGVRFTRQDRFCLDGEPLVLVSGTYAANGAQYRAEKHDYGIVTSAGTQGSGPQSFELRRPDGLVYRYGNDADSRIEAGGSNEVRTWALNEVEDRFGQRMAFQYMEDGVTGEYHPVEIRWTYGAGESPAQARYRLSLAWEQRPESDQRSGFAWGTQWRDSRRLSSIEYAHDAGKGFTPVHVYGLAYATPSGGDETGTSLLSSVTQCGPRDCLQPTVFSWNDVPAEGALWQVPFYPTSQTLVGDFNGDGATDILNQADGYWAVLPANPQEGGFLDPIITGAPHLETQAVLIIDYNGDGLDDLLIGTRLGPNWLLYQSPTEPGGPFIVRNTGVAWSANAVAIDMDGDGLGDLAYLRNGQVYFRRNTGGAFGAEMSAGLVPVPAPGNPVADSVAAIKLADFDGDGRRDLLVFRSMETANASNWRWEAFLSTGNGFGPEPIGIVSTHPSADHILVLDINGDGLSDVLAYADGGWRSYLSRGTASGGSPGLVPQACASPLSMTRPGETVALDYDEDGRSDILQPLGNTAWQVHLSSGSCIDTASHAIRLPAGGSLKNPRPLDIDGDGRVEVLFHYLAFTRGYMFQRTRTQGTGSGTTAPHPGLLQKVVDGLGNSNEFTYLPLSQLPGYLPTGNGPPQALAIRGGPLAMLTRVSTGEGNADRYNIDFSYSGGWRDTRGRGFLGFDSVRTRDSRNGLETVTQFRLDFPFTGLMELVTTWDQGRKVSVYDPAWAAATVAIPDPALDMHFVYLAGDRTDSYEVDTDGGQRGSLVRSARRTLAWNLLHGAIASELTELSSPVNPGQNFRTTRSFSYDDAARGSGCFGLPTRVDVSHDVSGAATQSRSVLMSYSTTSCRLLTQTEGPAVNPAQQLRTIYSYDALGRTATVTRMDGAGALPARVTRFGYEARGSRPITEAQVITGEPDYVVGHAWNEALGLETGRSDPRGMLTGWQFDDFGRVRVEARSTGSTQTSYTACGPCFAPGARYAIREARSDQHWTETQHDSLGRIVGRAFVLVDGRTSRQIFEYEPLGTLRRQSAPFVEGAPAVYWTTSSYDLLGRPKTITQPVSEAAPNGAVSIFTYAGLDTSIRNASGQTTAYRYDAGGRLVRVDGPLGSTASQGYDASGQLTSIVDAGGNTRRFTYDERGQLISSDDPDAGLRSFSYDAFGQLVQQSDGKSPANVMTMRYDQLGRPIARTEPEGSTTWSYVRSPGAGRGLLQRVMAPLTTGTGDFQEYYLYNTRGQLQRTVSVIEDAVYQTDYTYGPEGKLVSMTYPETVGWRPRFVFTYAHGHLNMIAQYALGVTPIYELLEMDAEGRDTWSSFGNGAVEEHNDYDRATGQLMAIRSGDPATPAGIQDYTYEWDAVGNLTRRRSQLSAAPHQEQFAYDELSRLIRVSLDGVQTLAMAYGADGNILHKSDAGNFSYGAGGRGPHAVTAVTGGPRPAMSFTYDANGNMTGRNGASLSWTSFNLPKQVSSGADFVRFSYGPGRSRVLQQQQTGRTGKSIHYAGPHFEAETEGDTRRYRSTLFAYGRAVYSQVESTQGGIEAYYILHDHLGSVDRLVRAAGTGADVLPLSFDAWGKRRQTGWSPDPADLRYGDRHWVERGFTGHEHLDNVRLVNMNGRLEDPLLGRMLSPDPATASGPGPQGLNPYSYVNNNPASYFDPSGYFLSKLRKTIKRGLRHIGSIGQRLVRNWGKPALAAVAAYYTAGTVSSWAYAAQASAAGVAAGTAGGVAATSTLTAAATSSAILGGMAGGAVAGAIATGNLRGVTAGAITGGLMGSIGVRFGNGYSAGRVLAEASIGGLGAELQGGDFRDGFITSGSLSTMTWAAVEMRRVMVEQSRLNPDNAAGISDGLGGDRFKLGGCRVPCNGSPLGGRQGGVGRFLGMRYESGSFLDHLIETYAGPHDFLNSPIFYGSQGNNLGRPAIFQAINAGNVLLATPFAAASLVPAYAYGAFGD